MLAFKVHAHYKHNITHLSLIIELSLS